LCPLCLVWFLPLARWEECILEYILPTKPKRATISRELLKILMTKILTDYRGFPVRKRLLHILDHTEMAVLKDRIEETLQYPEQVRKSNTDNQVILNYRYYLNTLMGNKWLCVVTKYLDKDAFLLTAYLTNRIKQGELLWPLT